MSTFKGIVDEFPHIRIDHFRLQPGQKAPLACFLSHVHSDHLTGLESLRSPFVYCSAATREILLRLEKYHYRVNFARGILESRNVTYDRSMRRLAKPLPLDTPTTLELAPGNRIRVTLIDANHCIGAVMFLIEGDGRAVLYTGDIRAEAWWVNSLVQNPILLPYTVGSRRLDCMYLDTTFATKSQPYRQFPSKAEGIKELLEKVETCPSDAIFYFHSWTFGYESVWIALANFLDARIHLDDYKTRIYTSLSTLDKQSLVEVGFDVRLDNRYLRESGLEVREATALCGFRHGNHIQPGCLTSQSNVRIHSCERGMGCPVIDDTEARVVHIIPIVTRSDGIEIAELGAGGGKGDLDQKEELDTDNAVDVEKLMELCTKSIKDTEILSKVLALLQDTVASGQRTIDLDMDLKKESQESDGDLSLQTLVSVLSSNASKDEEVSNYRANRSIRFPYSRHSSYYELCALVDAFKPKDVFPCTVDEDKWDPELGMRHLFGAFCSENIFRHDEAMAAKYASKLDQEADGKRERETQAETQSSDYGSSAGPAKRPRVDAAVGAPPESEGVASMEFFTPANASPLDQNKVCSLDHSHAFVDATSTPQIPHPVNPLEVPLPSSKPPSMDPAPASSPIPSPPPASALPSPSPPPASPAVISSTTTLKGTRPSRKPPLSNKQIAYEAALGIRLTWADYGGLVSTKTRAEQEEEEL